MQAASDIFLGWSEGGDGRHAYVRQLRDMKVAARPETFTPRLLNLYAEMCGMALARAPAKAGDAPTIAGYIGKGGQFGEALADHAVGYADQVEKDYALFQRAVRSGRLTTDTSSPTPLGDDAALIVCQGRRKT